MNIKFPFSVCVCDEWFKLSSSSIGKLSFFPFLPVFFFLPREMPFENAFFYFKKYPGHRSLKSKKGRRKVHKNADWARLHSNITRDRKGEREKVQTKLLKEMLGRKERKERGKNR